MRSNGPITRRVRARSVVNVDSERNRPRPGDTADWRRSMFDDMRAHNERRSRRLRQSVAERQRRVEREMRLARQRWFGANG